MSPMLKHLAEVAFAALAGFSTAFPALSPAMPLGEALGWALILAPMSLVAALVSND